jgi:hypothetical protein
MTAAALTLQFQPDWPFRGEMVIESMARDGVYRSQFETGTSNGGLTAHEGGDRWRWESRLFDRRYDEEPAARRSVYGALNRRDDPYGGSPRFGSAFIRLAPDVLARSTFCFPDSVYEPDAVGGPERISELAAMADAAGHDYLDDYVEAHVHGGVRFDADVEAIVLDPCFAGTPIEDAAARLGAVEWHPGFLVETAGLDADYRGAEIVALARMLGDVLTPDVIGVAARTGDRDSQALKKVWHCLARFGRR